MSQILNPYNFIKDPIITDRLIYICDSSGKVIQTIDPYSSTFYNKLTRIYILSDGKQSINNLLEFATENDCSIALNRLNETKQYFINKTNNQLIDGCSRYITLLNTHTADTSLHVTLPISQALRVANNPSILNPFVTIADIGIYSGERNS